MFIAGNQCRMAIQGRRTIWSLLDRLSAIWQEEFHAKSQVVNSESVESDWEDAGERLTRVKTELSEKMNSPGN